MIVLVLGLLGLITGSFVNAATWRLHEQSKKQTKKLSKELSIVKGHSMCPNCHHRLAALDLIPVFSWLMLRGKCRYCHNPISWQYPFVELLTAALFIFSYVYWPVRLHQSGLFLFIIWLLFLIGFVALVVYDYKWSLLPNKIIYPLLLLGLVQVIVMSSFYHDGHQALLGALWGVLIDSGVFYLIFQVSQGRWIGGGDVKLGAVLGLLVGGPSESILLLFLASTMGTLFSLPLLLTHRIKATTRIPFGPFLILAAIVTTLFGASIIRWYKTLYL